MKLGLESLLRFLRPLHWSCLDEWSLPLDDRNFFLINDKIEPPNPVHGKMQGCMQNFSFSAYALWT